MLNLPFEDRVCKLCGDMRGVGVFPLVVDNIDTGSQVTMGTWALKELVTGSISGILIRNQLKISSELALDYTKSFIYSQLFHLVYEPFTNSCLGTKGRTPDIIVTKITNISELHDHGHLCHMVSGIHTPACVCVNCKLNC